MADDGGAKLEDVQRALGALVFDAGVRRLLAADDDDLPMSQLRTRMLAKYCACTLKILSRENVFSKATSRAK